MKKGPRRQYETESTYPPAYAELPYSDWTKDTRGAAADLQATALGGTGKQCGFIGAALHRQHQAHRDLDVARVIFSASRVGKQGRVPACFRIVAGFEARTCSAHG